MLKAFFYDIIYPIAVAGLVGFVMLIIVDEKLKQRKDSNTAVQQAIKKAHKDALDKQPAAELTFEQAVKDTFYDENN